MTTLVFVLRGLFGIAVLVGIAYACSSNRRQVNWRLVGVGILLQLGFALVVLKTAPGRALFEFVGSVFARVLSFTSEGSRFIFGPLGIAPGQDGSIGYIFAFQVLPTIIFFGALMGMLYYLKLVQPVVRGIGVFMARTMKISGAESLATAANVFIGQTEAPLVIRPYIQAMTRSELMTLMTGGMATIAGGVLASYILFLGGDDPAQQAFFAGHLLSASIMSAPAAIVMAKIMVPETEAPSTTGHIEMEVPVQGSNVLEATADGAAEGLKLALNVAAMLLAFIALLAMLNYLLGLAGRPVLFGWEAYDLNAVIASWTNDRFTALSLQSIFAFIFAPIAWAMGVPTNEVLLFGSLLGEKIAVNEFIAYLSLGNLKAVLSERTTIIAAYALCGFANFSSIAIQIGGIGGIAPERRSDVAKLGIQAVIGGALASWMTATIAGMLIG
ncbi:MAG: nucleoside transporter C-terminal domain-containing protein [Rhodothermales bacterium]|nr:nucleoside transporter C-terminal domain-containing protein [Rhodothermales bacterium]